MAAAKPTPAAGATPATVHGHHADGGDDSDLLAPAVFDFKSGDLPRVSVISRTGGPVTTTTATAAAASASQSSSHNSSGAGATAAAAAAGAVTLVHSASSSFAAPPHGSTKPGPPPRPTAPSNGHVTTLAGSSEPGCVDGWGTQARFHNPESVVVDSAHNVYVSDRGNARVRKITPDGHVTTFAGASVKGHADGQGTHARFESPRALAIDAHDTLFVVDAHRVRRVDAWGCVTTVAGTGVCGADDGPSLSAATFDAPQGIACAPPKHVGHPVAGDGNVFVVDSNRIRRISPHGTTTTFCGGARAGKDGYVDGQPDTVQFDTPRGLCADPRTGSLYVADQPHPHGVVRRITTNGVCSTFAGAGTSAASADAKETGLATRVRLSNPSSLAISASGVLYVCDLTCTFVRAIDLTTGLVTRFAGHDTQGGHRDGAASSALFEIPQAVAVDSHDNVYVVDGNRIRRIAAGGMHAPGASAGATAGGAAASSSAAPPAPAAGESRTCMQRTCGWFS